MFDHTYALKKNAHKYTKENPSAHHISIVFKNDFRYNSYVCIADFVCIVW